MAATLSPGDTVLLARLRKLRSFKPGKFGKGLIQSEQAPEAMIWRTAGGWNGEPHHADVSEVLAVKRPNVAFHIDRQRRFYFHSEDPGFVHPKDPGKLAAHVHRQYPKLTWGRISAEDYERANGFRDTKTLAASGRPLRDFERGAHLHVLDWSHQTARQRFQVAGNVQVKAAAKAVVKGSLDGPPHLPALEAAIHGELRKLYAVGHATVRSELDHQRTGEPLPIGLSKAPAPPNLRHATGAKKRCGTCKMFDNGACWGYGNYGVEPDELCDSWAAETVKTLALSAPGDAASSLIDRARLAAADVGHQIWQAVHRGRLQGHTDRRVLRQLGQAAGHAALRAAASHHAGGAISAGRHAAATAQQAQIVGGRYTSVLDKSSCGECVAADTGQLLPLGDPAWIPAPNPACLGGDRCRCIIVYQLEAEPSVGRNTMRPGGPALLPPDDFPSEPRQPDRPSGVGAMRVAQVGVGAS